MSFGNSFGGNTSDNNSDGRNSPKEMSSAHGGLPAVDDEDIIRSSAEGGWAQGGARGGSWGGGGAASRPAPSPSGRPSGRGGGGGFNRPAPAPAVFNRPPAPAAFKRPPMLSVSLNPGEGPFQRDTIRSQGGAPTHGGHFDSSHN